MSQRLTFGQLVNDSAYRIPTTLGVCEDDPRLLAWANIAEEAMANQGRWWGSIWEAQFCVTEGCIVFPREVATIEQIAICGQPMDYQNGWYAFTRLLTNLKQCSSCASGTGRGACACGHLQMREKPGFAVSFKTVVGSNKVLRAYPTHSSDVGKKITFQGYDENNIWVRTENGAGDWIDGEEVTLALPFVDTTTVWRPGAPTGVIKAETNQRVLVYSYDTVAGTEIQLAIYEPTEVSPMYRQAFIPNFRNIRCCDCDNDSEDPQRTVTALVSLQHVPIQSNNDWMLFQNAGAYKMAMQAAKLWEDPQSYQMGNFYFYGTQAASRNGRGVERVVNRGAAIPLLVAELRKMTADRTNIFVNLDQTNRPVADMIGFR